MSNFLYPFSVSYPKSSEGPHPLSVEFRRASTDFPINCSLRLQAESSLFLFPFVPTSSFSLLSVEFRRASTDFPINCSLRLQAESSLFLFPFVPTSSFSLLSVEFRRASTDFPINCSLRLQAESSLLLFYFVPTSYFTYLQKRYCLDSFFMGNIIFTTKAFSFFITMSLCCFSYGFKYKLHSCFRHVVEVFLLGS
jgi:hypothetical protein